MTYAKEQEFLRLAARRPSENDRQKKPDRLIVENLDWQYIRQQAFIHRISPLLYDRYFTQPPVSSDVPGEVIQYFQDAYQQTYLWNTVIYQQLSLVLQEFQQHNIVPVVLKGGMLAKWVYRNIALRPMQDIDLLLDDQDIDTAARILRNLGYSNILHHLTYLSDWHRTHEERLFAGFEHQGYHLPTLIKKWGNQSICIELHRLLTPLMRAKDARSLAIPGADFPLRTLRPEYFLLHLGFHIQKHVQHGKIARLIWLCDIAEYLHVYGSRIDWSFFLALCQQYQVEQEVLLSLSQARTLLDVSFPLELPLSDHQMSLSSLFPEKEPDNDRLFFQTISQTSPTERVRYIWESLFPSHDFMLTRYAIRHRWMVYLYYPLRLLKACGRSCRLVMPLVREKSCRLLSQKTRSWIVSRKRGKGR